MRNLLLAPVLLISSVATAQECPALTSKQEWSLLGTHTTGFGDAVIPGKLIVHRPYVFTFDYENNVPNTVLWRAEPSFRDTPERKGKWKKFRPDMSLKDDDLVVHEDYTNSGYHRGHIAPFFISGGDRDKDGMDAEQEGVQGLPIEDIDDACTVFEINYMSNITPQLPEFNSQGGAWYDLESQVRDEIDAGASFNIMAGTLFFKTDIQTIGSGETKIGVPDAFFKTVKKPRSRSNPTASNTSYLFWHTEKIGTDLGCLPKEDLTACIVSPDDLHKVMVKDIRRDVWTNNSQANPVVRVQAQHPKKARRKGIEGRVKVSFTVGTDGSVVKKSIKVIAAEPKGYFEKAAIKSAAKFKYRPKKVDGQAVPMENQEWVFNFNLKQSR